MSKIRISHPHNLGYDAACTRLGSLLTQLETKYGVRADHKGDTGGVTGKGVNGKVQVSADRVDIDLKLGLPASLVAGKIEQGIARSLAEHFPSE